MEKIMAAYGYGIIQNCTGLLTTLEKEGFTKEDFFKYAKEYTDKKFETLKKEVLKREKKREIENNKVKKTDNEKITFLKSGETELMKGVVCDKCGDKVYIEGICRSNPLVKEGYIRRGICGNCSNTFGIR